MINEGLEAIFELDLRVLKTLPTFFFLPGRLTKEYIDGRRRRYIRPFRLYLFATFLLFTILALTQASPSPRSMFTFDVDVPAPAAASLPSPDALAELADSEARTAIVSGILSGRSLSGGTLPLASNSDSRLRSLPKGDSLQVDRFREWLQPQRPTGDSARVLAEVEPLVPPVSAAPNAYGDIETRQWLSRLIRDSLDVTLSLSSDPVANARMERLLREKAARAVEDPGRFVGDLIDRMPYMMFLLLPLFALLLKLLYLRRRRLYMEHLIFTLHMHALTFFAFAVGMLLEESGIGWIQSAGAWILISPLVYLILAMQTVYGQSLAKTTLKALALLGVYVIILVVGILLLAILTVALM
jgi:hypothetical protein